MNRLLGLHVSLICIPGEWTQGAMEIYSYCCARNSCVLSFFNSILCLYCYSVGDCKDLHITVCCSHLVTHYLPHSDLKLFFFLWLIA